MRACRADREHLGPAAHQQHLLVAAMADQLAAIGKIGERDALRQIRPVMLGVAVFHACLPDDPLSEAFAQPWERERLSISLDVSAWVAASCCQTGPA